MLGVVMVIQLGGMIVHRVSTIFHIMSTTGLNCWGKESDKDETENMVALAISLGRIQSEGQFLRKESVISLSTSKLTWSSKNSNADTVSSRKPPNIMSKIGNNVRKKGSAPITMSVDRAFERRFRKLQNNMKEYNEDHPLDMEYIQNNILGNSEVGRVTQHKTMVALRTMQQQTKMTLPLANAVTHSTHV